MSTFFTSDEHYGHANIIKFCNRPFKNVDDMREALIANHNARVGENDQTFHLGDFAWRHVNIDGMLDILNRLNGRHFLIWGNHDERAEQLMSNNTGWLSGKKRFEWAKNVHMFREDGIRIWLSHYAHRAYPESHKGAYHLYGHTHAVLPDYRLSTDVGVDNCNYAPVSLEEIDTIMTLRKRTIGPDEVQRDMDKNKWNKEGN